MREFLRVLSGLGWAFILMVSAGALLTAVAMAWNWLAQAG